MAWSVHKRWACVLLWLLASWVFSSPVAATGSAIVVDRTTWDRFGTIWQLLDEHSLSLVNETTTLKEQLRELRTSYGSLEDSWKTLTGSYNAAIAHSNSLAQQLKESQQAHRESKAALVTSESSLAKANDSIKQYQQGRFWTDVLLVAGGVAAGAVAICLATTCWD